MRLEMQSRSRVPWWVAGQFEAASLGAAPERSVPCGSVLPDVHRRSRRASSHRRLGEVR